MKASRLFSVATLTCCFLLSCPIFAQTPGPSASHKEAALDLYRIVGGNKTAEAGSEAMITAMTSQNQEMVQYSDILRTWIKKVFSDEKFEREVVLAYTDFFTEKELRELIRFYKSDLGQKSIVQMPLIMQKCAAIGTRLAQEHSQELKDAIENAAKTKKTIENRDNTPAPQGQTK